MALQTVTGGVSIMGGAVRLAGYGLAYIFFGLITSLVAAIFGFFFFLFVSGGPVGIFFAAILPVPLIGLPIAFILSLPVTFITLPLIAIFLKDRPATHLLISIVGGAATGAAMMFPWQGRDLFPSSGDPGPMLVLIVGSTAGLVAGMTYASLVRKVRR